MSDKRQATVAALSRARRDLSRIQGATPSVVVREYLAFICSDLRLLTLAVRHGWAWPPSARILEFPAVNPLPLKALAGDVVFRADGHRARLGHVRSRVALGRRPTEAQCRLLATIRGEVARARPPGLKQLCFLNCVTDLDEEAEPAALWHVVSAHGHELDVGERVRLRQRLIVVQLSGGRS